MLFLPHMKVGGVGQLVIALAVAFALFLTTLASLPALLVLPFFPAAADRADRLVWRLVVWTERCLLAQPGR